MATYTPNFNFKKPSASDAIDIADINGNFDSIDTMLGGWQTVTLGLSDVPAFVDNTTTIAIPYTQHRCIIDGNFGYVRLGNGGFSGNDEDIYVQTRIFTPNPLKISLTGGYKFSGNSRRYINYTTVSDGTFWSKRPYIDGGGYTGTVSMRITSSGIMIDITRDSGSYTLTSFSATFYVMPF